MDSEKNQNQNQIPIIDLSNVSADEGGGSKEWQTLCKKVRACCEDYGCFEVVYSNISQQVQAEFFKLVRQLSMLPLETKQKNYNPKSYHGFGKVSIYEGFGIEDASCDHSLKGFGELLGLLHHQIDHLCNTFGSIRKPLDDLHRTIEKLILDSYGLGGKMDSIMPCKTLLRTMKYTAPSSPAENAVGLFSHTDKPMCTLLCEDEVSHLEVETKLGQWIRLSPSPNSLVFLVGDPVMICNGSISSTNTGNNHPTAARFDR